MRQCIDLIEKMYGDKQGKKYQVWVDRVSSAQIGSDAWLVKFDKWESSGEIFVVLYNIFTLYSSC